MNFWTELLNIYHSGMVSGVVFIVQKLYMLLLGPNRFTVIYASIALNYELQIKSISAIGQFIYIYNLVRATISKITWF